MHSEAQFLVPIATRGQSLIHIYTRARSQLSPRVWCWRKTEFARDIPARRLAAALVCLRLLGLLAQPRSTIRVLLPYRPAVRQVFGLVEDNDQITDLRPVDGHVGVDSSRMGAGQAG